MAHSPQEASPVTSSCSVSSSSTSHAIVPLLRSEPIGLKNPLLIVQAPHLFSAHYRAFGDKPTLRSHPARFPRQGPHASKPVQGCSTHTPYHCHPKSYHLSPLSTVTFVFQECGSSRYLQKTSRSAATTSFKSCQPDVSMDTTPEPGTRIRAQSQVRLDLKKHLYREAEAAAVERYRAERAARMRRETEMHLERMEAKRKERAERSAREREQFQQEQRERSLAFQQEIRDKTDKLASEMKDTRASMEWHDARRIQREREREKEEAMEVDQEECSYETMLEAIELALRQLRICD